MAYDRCSGVLIGRGGLSRTATERQSRLEVGWTFRRESWGNGFATEIGNASLACAFDEVRAAEVVVAAVFEVVGGKIAAWRVLRRRPEPRSRGVARQKCWRLRLSSQRLVGGAKILDMNPRIANCP
jgi:hypothetical protein